MPHALFDELYSQALLDDQSLSGYYADAMHGMGYEFRHVYTYDRVIWLANGLRQLHAEFEERLETVVIDTWMKTEQ